MTKPMNYEISLSQLIDDIKTGELRIPEFQRAPVWDAEAVETLLESVVEEYPIGLFLVWKTSEQMKERDPFNLKLQSKPKGQSRMYLLDGQQRTMALVGSFIDTLFLGKKGEPHRAFYDLKERKFKVIKKADIAKKTNAVKIEDWYLPLNELFKGDNPKNDYQINEHWVEKHSGTYLNAINNIFLVFSALRIPAVMESKALSAACKIFERLNNTGVKLSVVDLMVAKTYSSTFNLRDQLADLIAKFASKSFEITEISILQAMTSCIKKSTSRDAMIDSADEIVSKWETTSTALNQAIDFLTAQSIVPVAKFLPSEIMLSPITYFFHENRSAQLTSDEINALKRYVWIGGLSSKYVHGQAVRAKEDMQKITDYLDQKKKASDLFIEKIDLKAKEILYTELDWTSVPKTILCIMASKKPREFEGGKFVNISGAFAHADSNSMHHIFPKRIIKVLYDGRKKYNEEIAPFINSITNISMISLESNRKIWDSKPSVYLPDSKKGNKTWQETLESQFITDTKEFGLDNDNFPLFIKKRAELMEKTIKATLKEISV